MIVLTLGTFDLLHEGHLELLSACHDLAGPPPGRVVVGLNRDAFVERYKGRLPVQPYGLRAASLRQSVYVDLVVCNLGDENSGLAIDVVRPDVLAIGDDWLDADAYDPEARYLAQLGITHGWLTERRLHVEYIPRTMGQSTTRLRAEIGA